MDDEDVLGAVRQALAEVRMERPLDVIVQRGRSRRRKRVLYGVTAGGLAVAVVLALALPLITRPTNSAPTSELASPEGLSAWTMEKTPDTRVKLTLRSARIGDPAMLEGALLGMDVPATVKVGGICKSLGMALIEPKDVYEQGRSGRREWITFVTPGAIPPGSQLLINIVVKDEGPEILTVAVRLVPTGDQMFCTELVPPRTPHR